MRIFCMTLILIMYTLSATAQDDNWMVQIAAYDKQVSLNHFQNVKGKIFYSKDGYDFHRYFVGNFSEAEAKAKSDELKKSGYSAIVMHSGEFNMRCSCYKMPQPRELTSSLRSIFFDFDKYSLRPESKRQLNLLVQNLNENPNFTARLQAHTDAKGSNPYNDQLSKNRANSARKYLIQKGISSERIKIETFGENQPIAKNALDDGSDTEEGRQFNRRVELQLLDSSGNPIGIVEAINVPNQLSSSN